MPSFSFVSSGASLLALTASCVATRLSARDDACADLFDSMPAAIDNLAVNIAQAYDANATVVTDSGNLTTTLAFCRFSANVTTSDISAFRFELWMPDDYSGRFLMGGNGGDGGSVGYTDIQSYMDNYNVAAASTNTGHDSASLTDGTFARNNTGSAIDFAYRAVHLTAVYSKQVIESYYGSAPSYAYFSSCSGGGRQAWKEAQSFPDDFDGVIAGAPAMWTPRLDAHQYWRNIFVNNVTATGYISSDQWAAAYEEVLRQCDDLDGLHDLVITEPELCKPDLTQFACATTTSPNFDDTTCFTYEQLFTYTRLMSDWHSSVTGELIFPAHSHGTENQMSGSDGGTPAGLTMDYYNYQVLNYTTYISSADPIQIDGQNITELQLLDLVDIADEINPANTTAFNPDLTEYFNTKNGKVIHYHGAADGNIPTGSSITYRGRLLDFMGNVSNNYRFYAVEGMQHCGNGVGPVQFGQADANTPHIGDAKWDVLGAMFAWVENGTAPTYLIGAMYDTSDSGSSGPGDTTGATSGASAASTTVNFTRPICPYPEVARYNGGDWSDWESFSCM